MRRLPRSEQDFLDGTVTYDFGHKYLRVSVDVVERFGIEEVARRYGLTVPEGRLKVLQSGVVIGSVPATFDPMFIRSTSPLYEPRPTDLVREGDHWVADRMLGPGDLEAIPGFVWSMK